jgi:hypothetical protein
MNSTGTFLKSDDLSNKDDEDESTTALRGERKPLLEGSNEASSHA